MVAIFANFYFCSVTNFDEIEEDFMVWAFIASGKSIFYLFWKITPRSYFSVLRACWGVSFLLRKVLWWFDWWIIPRYLNFYHLRSLKIQIFFSSLLSSNDSLLSYLCDLVRFLSFRPICFHKQRKLNRGSIPPQSPILILRLLDLNGYATFHDIVFQVCPEQIWQ